MKTKESKRQAIIFPKIIHVYEQEKNLCNAVNESENFSWSKADIMDEYLKSWQNYDLIALEIYY